MKRVLYHSERKAEKVKVKKKKKKEKRKKKQAKNGKVSLLAERPVAFSSYFDSVTVICRLRLITRNSI